MQKDKPLKDATSSTLAGVYHTKAVKVDGSNTVTIHAIDTAGSDRFQAMTAMYCKGIVELLQSIGERRSQRRS